MRSVSLGVRRAVVLLAVLVIVMPAAYADDPPSPFDPPESRIKIPGGLTSQSRIKPPGGEPITDARISPPIGEPTTDARIQPPSEEPSFFELVLDWLRAQARISPPIG